jgi:hypothetical protein
METPVQETSQVKVIHEFTGFSKIPRFSREVCVTEKIDGSNASILIDQDGTFLTGSRTRWITLQDDNFGFSRWAHDHKDELVAGLGPGRHFGEWWGAGIQRKYGLKEKRLSLFNVERWVLHGQEPKQILTGDPRITKMQGVLPPCVGLVPVIVQGSMDDINAMVEYAMGVLTTQGSLAVPGWPNPEGIVIYHKAGNHSYKKSLVGDSGYKGDT